MKIPPLERISLSILFSQTLLLGKNKWTDDFCFLYTIIWAERHVQNCTWNKKMLTLNIESWGTAIPRFSGYKQNLLIWMAFHQSWFCRTKIHGGAPSKKCKIKFLYSVLHIFRQVLFWDGNPGTWSSKFWPILAIL